MMARPCSKSITILHLGYNGFRDFVASMNYMLIRIIILTNIRNRISHILRMENPEKQKQIAISEIFVYAGMDLRKKQTDLLL